MNYISSTTISGILLAAGFAMSAQAFVRAHDLSAENRGHSTGSRDADPKAVRSFEDLEVYAKAKSDQPYVPGPPLPAALKQLDYEQYREISFKSDQAIWRCDGLPFWLETFHRGFVQQDKVRIFTIGDSEVSEIPFQPENFHYGEGAPPIKVGKDIGHAGLRIVGTFPYRDDVREMLTFLGSSYFRALHEGAVYGSSARGLAIDIAMNKDEEFPAFRTFWIHRPHEDDDQLTILAHLDSPSVSGAYRFRFRPGNAETQIKIDSTLYFRRVPEKIGIAPLTSMWIWGDGLKGPPLDNRPSVHDSSGLLIRTADDQWIWRPYARQSYPSTGYRTVEELAGFGVMQRNRAFFHYDDHNARYDLRPSVWISPETFWTNGRVELLEIPGAHEGIDNIAAYWVPNEPPKLDEPLRLSYTVSVFAGNHREEPVAWATNLDVKRTRENIRLTIRFAGKALANWPVDRSLTPEVSATNGKVLKSSASRTDTGDWIVKLAVVPDGEQPVDLTVVLREGEQVLSETFTYLCPPKQPEFVYPQVYTRKE